MIFDFSREFSNTQYQNAGNVKNSLIVSGAKTSVTDGLIRQLEKPNRRHAQ